MEKYVDCMWIICISLYILPIYCLYIVYIYPYIPDRDRQH